jgi:hypothetical protein
LFPTWEQQFFKIAPNQNQQPAIAPSSPKNKAIANSSPKNNAIAIKYQKLRSQIHLTNQSDRTQPNIKNCDRKFISPQKSDRTHQISKTATLS